MAPQTLFMADEREVQVDVLYKDADPNIPVIVMHQGVFSHLNGAPLTNPEYVKIIAKKFQPAALAQIAAQEAAKAPATPPVKSGLLSQDLHCEVCGKACKSMFGLRAHRRSHTPVAVPA